MKVLHILRSEPTSTVTAIIEDGFSDDENVMTPLYDGEVDYQKLVGDLFASDQVISWW
jgi:hypothetical protein